MSCAWVKASACRLQITLSCAVLCRIVSLQYLSRSSLHRLADVPSRLFLSYGLQVVRCKIPVYNCFAIYGESPNVQHGVRRCQTAPKSCLTAPTFSHQQVASGCQRYVPSSVHAIFHHRWNIITQTKSNLVFFATIFIKLYYFIF